MEGYERVIFLQRLCRNAFPSVGECSAVFQVARGVSSISNLKKLLNSPQQPIQVRQNMCDCFDSFFSIHEIHGSCFHSK